MTRTPGVLCRQLHTFVLVLDQVIEGFQQEEHESVIAIVGKQKSRARVVVEQSHQRQSRNHCETLQVRRDVIDDGEQALVQHLQLGATIDQHLGEHL
jgi:hypothetical protein